ncbi:MAG TPA: SPOR domain-containing protein [Solirubrobacteraceae bacterium]|nr:SPOR domain-containing protein [Solirubrobacteraceae bacterium]
MTTNELASDARAREDDTLCAQCGAELANDQEWCLECGGARTLIQRGPDWRLPLAVIAAVIALAIGGFVVAVISISNDSGNPAAAVTAIHSRAAASNSTNAATATATTPAGSPANIGAWPVGLPGWTVVLAAEHTRASAYRVAERVAGQGIDVGVLDSSQHPSLAPGFWVVFSGRYPTQAAAQTASAQLVSLGQSYAHPRLVGRQGGP